MARDLIREAHHEAGHAVMAHTLGYPITLVSIARGKARCEADITSDDMDREHPVEGTNRRIRYYLGGIVADMRYPLANANGRYSLLGWGQDMVYVWRLAGINAQNLRSSNTQIIEEQLHRAARLLATRWQAVSVLADELADQGELPGDEVHAIIERELGRSGFAVTVRPNPNDRNEGR